MKTTLKYFNIMEYEEEAAYLTAMHEQGWKFQSVHRPGIYRFEKCKPEHVTYRLDYNKEGREHKDEYVQMFRDCGWEYILDFVGYSYFRCNSEQADSADIFCDDESRLDMIRRIFKGRMIPLLVIFFACLVPNIIMSFTRYTGGGDVFDCSILIISCVLLILYLSIFIKFALHYYHFAKNKK